MFSRLSRFLPARFRRDTTVIPVVRLHGAIMSGGSQLRQPLNIASTAGVLEKAFSIKSAPAVAISVNSPGGSPVQSRLIHARIRDLARESGKQVFIFVEDVAASGGYMIACAGDEIIADPSSIVGSIGVVYGAFGFNELIAKLGVERRVHTAGKNKVMLDPFQPEKKADVAYLKKLQEEIHQSFIGLVKESRGDRLSDDADLFTGLFWTGTRGLELGLVDQIGDMRSFIKDRFGEKAKLVLVGQPRGLFGRRVPHAGTAIDGLGANLADGVATTLEERALWARYGL